MKAGELTAEVLRLPQTSVQTLVQSRHQHWLKRYGTKNTASELYNMQFLLIALFSYKKPFLIFTESKTVTSLVKYFPFHLVSIEI